MRELGSDLLEFVVAPDAAVAGTYVRDLPLPRDSLVAVIVRGEESVLPRGSTRIEADDRLYVLVADREPARRAAAVRQLGAAPRRRPAGIGSRPVSGKTLAVIGAALDLGQGRRGVDMGPSAIRYAGLEERLTASRLPRRGLRQRGDRRRRGDRARGRARALPPADREDVRADRRRASREALERGRRAARARRRPLGGVGTLGGLAAARGTGGVLWIDAHGDLNTPETSPTGNVHGMPLAAALGLARRRFASELWPIPAVDPRAWRSSARASLDEAEKDYLRTRRDAC